MPEPQANCGLRGDATYSMSPAFGRDGVNSLRFRAPARVGNSRRRGAVIPCLRMRRRTTQCARRARPRTGEEDLFRSRLANMLDPRHALLLRLAALIDWAALETTFGPLYAEAGRP